MWGTRLWLAGEVSEQRNLGLIRRLLNRVRRAARRPLLICTDGFRAYPRAIREAFRDALPTGKPGRPRLGSGIPSLLRRWSSTTCDGAWSGLSVALWSALPAQVEKLRHRSQGSPGVLNTAYIERLNATFRERLAALTAGAEPSPVHYHPARGDVSDWHRLQLLHLSYEPLASRGQSPGTSDARHGGCPHRPPLDGSRTAVVPCSTATLDASQAARAAFACIAPLG